MFKMLCPKNLCESFITNPCFLCRYQCICGEGAVAVDFMGRSAHFMQFLA